MMHCGAIVKRQESRLALDGADHMVHLYSGHMETERKRVNLLTSEENTEQKSKKEGTDKRTNKQIKKNEKNYK